MKKVLFVVVVYLVIQAASFAQPTKEFAKKVPTTSEDILKEIIQSQNPKKHNESERTIITTISRVDGFVLVNKMGQYWGGSNWVNSMNILYTYTPEGLEIEEVDQFWNNGSWENSGRFLTTYNANNMVTLYEQHTWSGSNWVNAYQYISSYNASNKLIEYDVKQWNGAVWENMYKTNYTYSSSGNLEMIIDQSWNGSSWDNNYRYTYQYNVNNLVSLKLEEQWDSGNWVYSIRDIYSYNLQNLVSLIASDWWTGTAWKESVEIYYEYDGSENVIDKLTKFWESEILGLQNKFHTTYEYIPATSLESKVENQEWDLQSLVWINTSRDIYTYNGNNVLTHFLGESWNGATWTPGFQEIYSLDANGNVDTLLSQFRSGSDWINSFRSIHIWSAVIPVELTSFNIIAKDNSVRLSWETETEINNYGFEIERKIAGSDFITIGFVSGNGTTTEPKIYIFTDTDLSNGKYVYRLKQVDFNGMYEYSNEVEIDFYYSLYYSLDQNYPNPFNPSTKISWQSPSSGWQTIKVFDMLGREVATLVDEYRDAGNYEVEFQITSGNTEFASGIYYYQLRAGNYTDTKKMLLIK